RPPEEQTKTMQEDVILGYLPIFIYLIVVAFIGSALILVSALVGRKNPSAEKLSTYECGMAPIKDARRRLDIRFYLIAMLFILFDIEVVFLYPWAILFDRFEPMIFGFIEMVLFVAVLLLGYVYVWRKGALNWS
ncbi:MAG: NADH-quinone oxidoreductase subunit A, partial [bacterium]